MLMTCLVIWFPQSLSSRPLPATFYISPQALGNCLPGEMSHVFHHMDREAERVSSEKNNKSDVKRRKCLLVHSLVMGLKWSPHICNNIYFSCLCPCESGFISHNSESNIFPLKKHCCICPKQTPLL